MSNNASKRKAASSDKLERDAMRRKTLKGFYPTIKSQAEKVKDLKHDDPKFQGLVQLAEEGEDLFPELEKEEELASVTKEYQALMKKKDKKSEDYKKLDKIQKKKQKLIEQTNPIRRKIDSAMEAFEESRIAKAHHELHHRWLLADEWSRVYDCISEVLERYLDHVETVKNQEALEKAAANKARRAKKSKAASNNQSKATDDKEDGQVLVQKDGKEVPLDEALEGAPKSSRSRERAPWKGKDNKTDRSNSTTVGCELSEQKLQSVLNQPWSKTIKGGITLRGDNKHGEGLGLVNGRLHCTLCNTGIALVKSIPQHLAGKGHREKKEAMEKINKGVNTPKSTDLIDMLSQNKQKQQEQNLVGKRLPIEVDQYRAEALMAGYEANLSLGMLNRFAPFTDKHSHPSLTLGYAYNLPRTYNGPVEKVVMNKVRGVLSNDNCFPAFATITDATPIGCDAEAIKIRKVTKDYQIVEPLLRVSLFDVKQTGQNIGHSLLNCIKRYGGLDPADWRAAMQDRASTNHKAHKDIKKGTDYSPLEVDCICHTHCKPGEALNWPEGKSLRKAFNKTIKHRGKAYGFCKETFGEAPVVCGGVRWWIEWEQTDQMDRFGVVNMQNKYLPTIIDNKWSEKSAISMQNLLTPVFIPKAIVQIAAVAEVGKPFCQSTYILEGDDPLALTTCMVIEKLEKYVQAGPQFVSTKLACKQAAELVERTRSPLKDDITESREKLAQAKSELADAVGDVLALEQEESTTTARGRRRKAINYKNLGTVGSTNDESDLEQLKEQKEAALQKQTKANENVKAAEKTLHSKLDALDKLDKELGPISESDFLEHARQVVLPAFTKYNSIFHEDVGPGEVLPGMMRCKDLFLCFKMFDPLYLKSVGRVEPVEAMADTLLLADFPEFTLEFIAGLKKEIPTVLEYAQKTFDWDTIEGSKQCRNRQLSRIKRDKQRSAIRTYEDSMLSEEEEAMATQELQSTLDAVANESVNEQSHRLLADGMWMEDPGERARRIWEWWRIWIKSEPLKFQYFSKALRLVVLLQPSSAATERVFSQLQYIRRVCGNQLLEDSLSLRCLLRCNKGMEDDYEA